ncbi:MAG TPA: hypothetical protein VD971_04300 [Phycisphaerales bacterium]|nr:hypothetical protein [Phycisphaerales bacterium]
MTTRHRPSRAAFSLLETVLAAAIGAVILGISLTLLLTVQRSDAFMDRRAEQLAELQRMRLVMQRTFSTVLTAPALPRRSNLARAVPVTPSGGAAGAGQSPGGAEGASGGKGGEAAGAPPAEGAGRGGQDSRQGGSQGAGAAAGEKSGPQSGGARGGQAAAEPQEPDPRPPRVLLVSDERWSFTPMARREPDGAVTIQQPQRLEVVLVDSPVPQRGRDAFEIARAARQRGVARTQRSADGVEVALPPEEAEPVEGDETAPDLEAVRAVRGVFEFRPQPLRPREVRRAEDPPRFQLVWVPLPPRRTPEEEAEITPLQRDLERAALGTEFVVASDLTFARWRVFHERQKKAEYAATTSNQLPAYVELEVETDAGLEESWLFEVAWATGPETRSPQQSTSQPQSTAGGAGAAGQPAGGGRGGAGQPAGGAAGSTGGGNGGGSRGGDGGRGGNGGKGQMPWR